MLMFPGMKFSKLKETGGFKRTKGRIKQWGEVMDERLGCKQRNARVMVEARLLDRLRNRVSFRNRVVVTL